MNVKKIFLVIFLLLSISSISFFVSYKFFKNYFRNKKNENENFKHLPNSELHFYRADLDHDGKIGKNEKKLTWKESYDVLIRQSNDPVLLEKIADKMNINKKLDRSIRVALARNEVLHQAEDLLISTGCVVPIYNASHVFLKKDFLKGVEHNCYRNTVFDNAYCEDKDKKKDEITVCVGTEPKTLDFPIISQVQSATIAETCSRSLLFYPDRENFRNELGIVIESYENNKTFLDIYIGNFKLKKGNTISNDIKDYEFIDSVYWDDGKKIDAKDLIWSINRIASPITGSSFRYFTSVIEGYEEFEKSELERIKEIKKSNNTYTFYNGLSGIKETTGEKKASDFNSSKKDEIPSLRIAIKNDQSPSIFVEGIKSIILAFSPRHRMTKNTEKENETLVQDWWQYTSNNKKDGKFYFCCCGPFKAEKINYQNNGEMVLVKNDKYHNKDNIKLNKITFKFFSSTEAAETAFNDNKLDFNCFFSKTKVKVNEKGEFLNEGFNKVNLPTSKYLFFNVNDDSLDTIVHPDDSPRVAEKKRQKARYIFSLLLDRNHICNVCEKGLSYPSRGVVSGSLYEMYIPKRNNDGVIDIDNDANSKDKVEWCTRNGYVPKKYNRFEERGKKNENELFEIYLGSEKDDKDYEEKIKSLKKRNIEKALEIADEINLKYEYKDGNLKFLNFPSISIICSNSESLEVFQHIQNYFKKFGIQINIDKREFNYVCSAMDNGRGAVYSSGYSADFDDPLTFLILFTSENSCNFCQLGKNSYHKSNNKRNKDVIKGLNKKK